MTTQYIKDAQLELDFNIEEEATPVTNIGKRMWKATSSSTIMDGVIIDEMTDENGWALVKINWNLPHPGYKIREWQRVANIRTLED